MNLYIINESTARGSVYGIGTYIRELTHALNDCPFQIYLIHLKSDRTRITIEDADGIQQWYFPGPLQKMTVNPEKRNKLYYRNIVYLLQLHIKAKDHLIFHLNFNLNDTLINELKKTFVCKVISVVHYSKWGFTIYDNLKRLRMILNEECTDSPGKKVKIEFEEEKSCYENADHVICLSEYMYKILCRDYQIRSSKVTIIPNGLADHKDTNTHADKKQFKKRWKLPDKDKIVLFAGRVDGIKGVEFLIKAFQKVLLQFSHCRLIIAGDGIFKTYIKESQDICTRITYTGLLDKLKLYELYQLADVGVVPSLYEPFGYVAVEMMMHRLPLVVTATSGLNEVVDDSGGLKVPVIEYPDKVEIDTALLAEKILYLLQHPKEAKQMGKNGRNRYLENYSSEIFGRNMINLYRSLFS